MNRIHLLSTLDYIKKQFGERFIDTCFVEEAEMLPNDHYLFHYLDDISSRTLRVSEISVCELYEMIGRLSIKHLLVSNYEAVIYTLGRDYRSFLLGFDNYKDYIDLFFPQCEIPLLINESENEMGCQLSCISKKKELNYYVKGFIYEIGRSVYKEEVTVFELVESRCNYGTQLIVQVNFENKHRIIPRYLSCHPPKNFTVNPKIFGKIFPFSIIISTNMKVKGLGLSLLSVIPFALNELVANNFKLNRPWIPFEFTRIMVYSNHVFDLLIDGKRLSSISENLTSFCKVMDIRHLKLKGKVIFVRRWRSLIFLGAPIVDTLSSLTTFGLHINHLAVHDSSRDFMLAEAQQTLEFKLAFEQGKEKQRKMERSLIRLEEEMKRTQTILHYLVPEKLAVSLRKGTIPLNSCKLIENVTILVSDVVKFTVVCSTLKPMEVVTTLNSMYSVYDILTAKHGVCKVETVGDAYMVVSNTYNMKVSLANKICDIALDMIDVIRLIKNPETGVSFKVRIGINTGAAVAGVVGLKVPKFCIFGTSVKTAVTLEGSSLPMKIKISKTTRNLLDSTYKVSRSGTVYIQDNGKIETYWLISRDYQGAKNTSSVSCRNIV